MFEIKLERFTMFKRYTLVRIFQVVVMILLMTAQVQQNQCWAETLMRSQTWHDCCSAPPHSAGVFINWGLAVAPQVYLRYCVSLICFHSGSSVEVFGLALPHWLAKGCRCRWFSLWVLQSCWGCAEKRCIDHGTAQLGSLLSEALLESFSFLSLSVAQLPCRGERLLFGTWLQPLLGAKVSKSFEVQNW